MAVLPAILPCPVCDEACAPLDVVDFNKSCEAFWRKEVPPWARHVIKAG